MYISVGHLLLAAILMQDAAAGSNASGGGSPSVAPATSPGMLAARDAQRESARRQVKALGLEQSPLPPSNAPSDDFFLTPWPRPAGFADPKTPAASAADDAAPKVTKSSYSAGSSANCAAVPDLALDSLVNDAARRENVSGDLLRAVLRKESAGYPCATSPVGAMGLMQLMPGTARQLGVRDPYNAKQSVDAGARYLRELLERYDGDVTKALAAYNAGPGNVDAYGGVPPFAETQGYVGGILRMLRLDGQ